MIQGTGVPCAESGGAIATLVVAEPSAAIKANDGNGRDWAATPALNNAPHTIDNTRSLVMVEG
jgi:hypothetical protein